MNERQEEEVRGDDEIVPAAPAEEQEEEQDDDEREPVTHSLKGSVTVDLDAKQGKEDSDG